MSDLAKPLSGSRMRIARDASQVGAALPTYTARFDADSHEFVASIHSHMTDAAIFVVDKRYREIADAPGEYGIASIWNADADKAVVQFNELIRRVLQDLVDSGEIERGESTSIWVVRGEDDE